MYSPPANSERVTAEALKRRDIRIQQKKDSLVILFDKDGVVKSYGHYKGTMELNPSKSTLVPMANRIRKGTSEPDLTKARTPTFLKFRLGGIGYFLEALPIAFDDIDIPSRSPFR